MNQREWKKSGKFTNKYEWYNQVRRFQRSLQYNPNPEAKIIHHLRDTEEQRKYNDEHYEFWGFDQNGTFEYGKYVIFVTREEHSNIHKCSEETCKKKSIGLMGKGLSEAHRLSISKSNTGKKRSEESKLKQSKAISGANNHNYGKHKSDITKDRLRRSCRKSSIERIAPVKTAYYEYKENGGFLSWNNFQKWFKENSSK